jgi:hypothetical protein
MAVLRGNTSFQDFCLESLNRWRRVKVGERDVEGRETRTVGGREKAGLFGLDGGLSRDPV